MNLFETNMKKKKKANNKKKTSKKVTKKNIKKSKKTNKIKNSIKKKQLPKKNKKKSPLSKQIKKSKNKVKKTSLKVKDNKIKSDEIKKNKNTFEDKIKEIFEKLINKNKVDGIYTLKIIEKAIPKKFRLSENIKKLENLVTSSNIKIYSEQEAKELKNQAKEESNKSDESNDEDEKKQTGKTDDPVRLYLRDMGAVELLSREGEIAIAKRIEAGREKMIGAICESPMTIRSIINWKDSIKDGTMLLRDIVDLEATYDMSDISDNKLEDTLKLIEGADNKKDNSQQESKKNKDDTQEESDNIEFFIEKHLHTLQNYSRNFKRIVVN